MKPSFSNRPPRRAAPTLIEPGSSLSTLLDDLAARMGPDQRAAFLAKMAAMDRQHGNLSGATVTLGHA